MRIKHPKIGDKRIRTKFLFFPLYIKKTNETRWLEITTWEEIYDGSCYGHYWEPIRWIEMYKGGIPE